MDLPPVIRALDVNTNGVIEAEEIANASAALRTLDKNEDGTLTAEELRPQPLGGNGQGRGMAPGGNRARLAGPNGQRPPVDLVMKALDTNGDGALSEDEIEAASESLTALDKNGDNRLERDEIRPAPPAGSAPPGAAPPTSS